MCIRDRSTPTYFVPETSETSWGNHLRGQIGTPCPRSCLLYTSDAADDLLCVDLGGRRIIKKNRHFLKKSSPGTNRHTIPQVSTLTYFVPKTSGTSWGNYLQGPIGTPSLRCQPQPILYQKQAKHPGEIISRDKSASRAPGVNPDLFCIKNKRNFLEKSSPGTNRHIVPQVLSLIHI